MLLGTALYGIFFKYGIREENESWWSRKWSEAASRAGVGGLEG